MQKQIQNDSPQWGQIDHQIQVITGKSSIRLMKVYKFDEYQPPIQSFLTKPQNDRYQTDATINLTDYSQQYCRKIIQKQIPLEDIIFYTGHLNIHKYSNQSYKIFSFLLCKINLGIVRTSINIKQQNYDSKIIPSQNDDQTFQYNFIINQKSQYQIRYKVQFALSDQKQFKLLEFSCCNCQNKIPFTYCTTQKLYFCQECCNDHHKPKLMLSHQLQPIDRVNTLGNCTFHHQKYQLYCLACGKYLCLQCTQKGLHSQGNDHIVKRIRDLYQQMNENIESLPKSNQQKIKMLLQNLQMKRKQIQSNQNQILQKIKQQYKKCVAMLQEKVATKYQLLNSCQLSLKMMLDKLAWNQTFCLFQSKALKPIYFFKSKSFFQAEMKKIKVPDFQCILYCKADLVYTGESQVLTRQELAKNFQIDEGLSSFNNNKGQNKTQHANMFREEQDKSANLLTYNSNATKPTTGQLFNELRSCDFKFFKIKLRQGRANLRV